VACARCGHDIRGLTEPKCPACGLDFDWAEAVPIEQLTCRHCGYHLYGLRDTRCPECGQSFTWQEALTAYHRRRIPLFEWQWRKRPVRSLMGTWLRALLPGRLWRTLDLHDPPQVGALWVMVAISTFASAIVWPILFALNVWIRRWIWGWWGPTPRVGELFSMILEDMASLRVYEPFGQGALWCLTSFASLMIFRQSMKQCKVRVVHVFRVWTYAVVLVLPVALTSLLSVLSALWWFDLTERQYLLVFCVVFVALCSFGVWLLCEGYKRYLRMPHSFGVALASQVIAWLCVAIVSVIFVALNWA
jgi:ribosomal protein L37E